MKTTIENRLIWLDGNIIPLQEAKINVLTPTAQFGANVFEGIRCYWVVENKQLYAFRLPEHYKRLKNSMKLFRMEERYSPDEMKRGLKEVIKANEYKEDITVRQTVFIDGFGTWSSKGPVNMFIAPIPKKRNLPDEQKGLNCCISSWVRISDRNMSPRVKVGANYINSRMAQMEALENGYDSAIFMNETGKIAEGPGSCLFMVRDGKLITPPCTASVLESITRDSIIELARNVLGIETLEREIDRTELYICDEAFLCGTSIEIAPIVKVDGYQINEGKAGLITNKVHEIYLQAVTSGVKGYEHWLTPIY